MQEKKGAKDQAVVAVKGVDGMPDWVLKPVDGSKPLFGDVQVAPLTAAQTELGEDFVFVANFENPDDKAFFEDVDPAVTRANLIVSDLRLKSVGVQGLTPDEKVRLDGYNGFISSVYSMRDEIARREQEAQEARAQQLIAEAEAILLASSSSEDPEAKLEEVKAIVDKLGSKATPALKMKLEELKYAIEAKAKKVEAQPVIV